VILILDFGSQYTQLIARCIRNEKVYCEVFPGNKPLKSFSKLEKVQGIILSGGFSNVYSKNALLPDPNLWKLSIPILGICYGMQLIASAYGGKVTQAKTGEFGVTSVHINNTSCNLFSGLNNCELVWMSHIDYIIKIPKHFKIIAKSDNKDYCAGIAHLHREVYGVQFHPEVKHSIHGKKIIQNFLFTICHAKKNWNIKSYVFNEILSIKNEVSNNRTICALSGGVDSAVASLIGYKAIGKQLICIYIDHGLQRDGETTRVRSIFKPIFGSNLIIVNAKKIFLDNLKGVLNPETKRKIIGHTFIKVFLNTTKQLKGIKFLLQGTIYSDIIESFYMKGLKKPIKSHHNVGGLPKKMQLQLIEPLRYLFKDEVRILGKQLGISNEILHRQPFPGPGFAIRIIGNITEKKLQIIRQADKIVIEEVTKYRLYNSIWQTFAILLSNAKTVGVMGDSRTYAYTIVIRSVKSDDAMTADWTKLPYDLLCKLSSRITNEVKGINRVVYDISSKPPATIEWE
jgi:GMP synthase (glutamine-hydrolysing)